MKIRLLFITFLVSVLSTAQTTLARYQFENNLTADPGSIGTPILTYSIATPTYNAGVTGLALTTGTAASANGAFLQITISTIGYSGITIGWSARTSNATTPGSWVLTGNSGSGFGGSIGTIPALTTTFVATGDILLGGAFDNNSSIVLRITSNNPSLRNLRIEDLEIKGTLSTPCTTPTTQATALSAINVTTTGTDLVWTDGPSTSGTLVSLRLAGAPTAPSSGTDYTPTLNFATAAGANLITAGNVVVAKSNAGTVTGITGLTAGTQYTATPYAYNGSGTNVCFNTTNPESFNFWTLANEPASFASFTSCGTPTANSLTVNFPLASSISATGYLLIYREGGAPTGMPVDGTVYAAGSSIGNSTVVNYFASGPRTINGLNSGATYFFALIPYNSAGSPFTANYRTSTYGTTNCSTSPAPEINVRGVVGAIPTITDGDTTPSGLDNTLYGTFVVATPSPTKTFRIENTGNAPLTISALSMVGGNSGDFTFPAITFPLIIAGGTSYDLVVTFTPGGAGTRTTTLTIVSNDSNEATYDFLIQGTGSATPIVDINVRGNGQSIPDNSIYPQGTNWTAFPVTLQFASSTRQFTIENLGSTALSLTGPSPFVQITGANASQFSVSIIPSNSIIGGGSTTFEITFTPTSGGTKNATILIYSNDSDENPYNFNIRGTCQGANNIYVTGNGNDVPKGSVTTAATNLTNFGLIPVTTGLQQNTFVITNLSGATRYLSNVSISGADASMFTIVSQPNNGAFGSGNTTSFTINFTPTSAGVKNATVTFNVFTNAARTTPDLLDPVFTFAISGEGIVYTPCSNNAVQTIAIQDFETTPATPTWTYSQSSDGNISLAGGTYNNGSGAVNAFVGSQSFQFRGNGTTTTRSAVVTLSAVDVSQYNNINFSMRVGAYRFSGTTQGLDVNDLVQVETSIDGGVNWSVESVLRGFTNSRWSFGATGVFNAYYTGNNSGVSLDTRNGNAELTGAAGISTYFVRNLPQVSNLLIRITLNVDRDDELWALDDIKIEGQTRQSTTWNGTTWSAGFPTPSTKAIFDGDYITTAAVNNGSVEACECQINSGRNVTIDSGYYFEIQSNITNAGTLTVANNGSLIQINDVATNVGNIVYQRTATGIRGYDYVYWSSPVVGQSVDNIYSSPTPGFKYKWNPLAANINSPVSSGRWEAASGTMDVGTGYIVRGSSFYGMAATNIPASFTGTVNNGIIPVTISRGGNTAPSTVGSGNGVTITNFDDNWNLVGNPYPSAIRALDFLNANTNIQGFVYLWTHGTAPVSSTNPFYSSFLYNYTTNDYITYNGTATTSGPTGFNGFIAGGQGFFVLMNDGASASATINFRNNMRNKTFANNQFYRVSQSGEEQNKHRIWLDLVDSNNIPFRTVIGYLPEATNGLDRLYDAYKNMTNERSIYSIVENETQIIQGRSYPFDSNDTVQLGVRILTAGEYKIAIGAVDGLFSEPTQAIYLEDKALGIVHDLRQSPYSFTATSGTFNDRFLLKYETNALDNPDYEVSNTIVLISNQGQLTVKSSEIIQSLLVYDILGRELLKVKALDIKEYTTTKISRSHQTLIVKIVLENGTIVTRKVVL